MKKYCLWLCALMLLFCLWGCGQPGSEAAGSPAEPPAGVAADTPAPVTSAQKEAFFDLARDNGFQLLPEFTAGTEPEWPAVLVYAAVLNEPQPEMSAEYVEQVATEYFGLTAVQHESSKEWKYADGVYTAVAMSYSPKPFVELISHETAETDGQTQVTATYVEYDFVSVQYVDEKDLATFAPPADGTAPPEDVAVAAAMEANDLTYVEAIRLLIANGETGDFVPRNTVTVVYLANADGSPARYLSVTSQES